MLISSIQDEELRNLAEYRKLKFGDTWKERLTVRERNNLMYAFDWNDSKEGHCFWDDVSGGITPNNLPKVLELFRAEIANNIIEPEVIEEEERDIREVLTEMGVEFFIK